MTPEFFIIGAGPGQHGLLTERARNAIIDADEVYASGRVAGSLASLRADWTLCPAHNAAELAAHAAGKRVAILIAGDAGFFGGVQQLAAQLRPHGTVSVYPGMNCVQYLCAQIGENYDDVFWMAEGDCDLLAAISYRSKVCALLDGTRTVGTVCEALYAGGLGGLRVVVGTHLGTGREQILDSTAQALCGLDLDAPAILLVFHDAAVDPLRPVLDTDLTWGQTGMMRQEVRWNAANLLEISPRDTVYDLGAGNGALSMELSRKAREGRVFAVEPQADARSLIALNREALGCYNVRVVSGQGTAVLQPLPAPDAVFIGANAGSLREILAALKQKNEHVRVVVAADRLERLSEAQMALPALGFRHITVSQLVLSRARTLGSYTMMLAGETLFLLSARSS